MGVTVVAPTKNATKVSEYTDRFCEVCAVSGGCLGGAQCDGVSIGGRAKTRQVERD